MARLARTPVHVELGQVSAALAVDQLVVAEARPLTLDRRRQDLADGGMQSRCACGTDAA